MSIALTNIVVSLKASTWEELEDLQLLNHALNGVRYNYFQVLKEEDGYRLPFFADKSKWIDPMTIDDKERAEFIKGAFL